MSPPPETTDTATPFRQVRVGEDWFDFEFAATAGDFRDRSAVTRALIAWYLRRPGATLPDRPAIEDWEAAAREAEAQRARDGVTIFYENGHTKQSKIRIGEDWEALKHAANAQGLDRAEVVRQLIAWYLRRRRAPLPDRPALEAWIENAPRTAVLDDREAFELALAVTGQNRQDVMKEFVAWYLHRPGAVLPKRPAVDLWASEAGSAG